MCSRRAAGCIVTHRVTVKGKQMKLAPRLERMWGNEDVVPYTLERSVQINVSTAPCSKTPIPSDRDGGLVPQPV
jgi:hypothetical protein